MHLMGITGNLGAGKTTLASILAWYFKGKVEAAAGQLELFANYDLDGAYRMQKKEDWFRVADAQGSLCIWDEAHRTFDSRRFSKFENIFATDLLTFVRKMAAIQCFVTPSIFRLDTRIREMLEVLIFVRQAGKKGISIDYYDFQADFGGRLGKYLHSNFIPGYKIQQIHKLNLFDSYSFVSGFPMPNNERSALEFMDKLEERHIQARKRLGLHIPRNHERMLS